MKGLSKVTDSSWRASKLAYTVEEVAGLLSLSRAQVYRLIEAGELSSLQIGKSRRVSSEQLIEFIGRLEQRSLALDRQYRNYMPRP